MQTLGRIAAAECMVRPQARAELETGASREEEGSVEICIAPRTAVLLTRASLKHDAVTHHNGYCAALIDETVGIQSDQFFVFR